MREFMPFILNKSTTTVAAKRANANIIFLFIAEPPEPRFLPEDLFLFPSLIITSICLFRQGLPITFISFTVKADKNDFSQASIGAQRV